MNGTLEKKVFWVPSRSALRRPSGQCACVRCVPGPALSHAQGAACPQSQLHLLLLLHASQRCRHPFPPIASPSPAPGAFRPWAALCRSGLVVRVLGPALWAVCVPEGTNWL